MLNRYTIGVGTIATCGLIKISPYGTWLSEGNIGGPG